MPNRYLGGCIAATVRVRRSYTDGDRVNEQLHRHARETSNNVTFGYLLDRSSYKSLISSTFPGRSNRVYRFNRMGMFATSEISNI